MKALTYTVWSVALVVFLLGGYLAIGAKRTEMQIRERAERDSGRRVRTEAPAEDNTVSGTTEKSVISRPAAGARTWKPTPMTEAERKAFMANALPGSPEARAAQNGIRVRMRYHALYESLGLSPAEIARFEKATAGKIDLFTQIVGTTPEMESSLLHSLASSMDRIVTETLGEAAVPKVREFIATADFREIADKLAANTFFTDTPLTAQQADRFVQACMVSRTEPGNGIRNDPATLDWDKVLRQADTFLSPAQLTALRAMTDIRRFDQEFRQSTGLPYRSSVRNF